MHAALSLIASLLLVGPVEDTKDGKFDTAKLVGTWKIIAGERGGEKVEEGKLSTYTVTVTKDSLTLKNAEATFVMKYELDTAKPPVTVKFTITESPFGAGATATGIVSLDGDTLKLCYALPGEGDPRKFESKSGSTHRLFVLKRSK